MIRFRPAPVPALFPVTILESSGRITVYIDLSLSIAEAMAALNRAMEEYLATGGLVQLHRGEVIALGLAEVVQQASARR
ncbi:hypothetical protein HHL19_36225 [Streptomyces sp. R302]|uniref:hypothetical protein n=1 Tax=unclassified Streptomyces TaxID=2593676 RepID=UPI00145DEEA9|nr:MULTISPECIES: hypothetical protein [unclassified Streptomyces]NML55700.1 hypothetical protein [Streptomyces sp. R301]NML83958.1 hypothetical protein [Streptomyces sp. R302]